MSREQREGNVILAGMWKTRNGHFHTMSLDKNNLEKILANVAEGGRLLLRLRTEESIARAQNPEKAPVAYLEFITKEQDEQFKSRKSGL